jgi:tetratricopeptide (TPR) repeat protein
VLTQKAKVARGRGREKEASQLLESIVERDGTRGDALLELADYYKNQGNSERALLLIERAEKVEEFEHPALLAHAQLLVAERDYAEAANLLRRALRIKHEVRVQQFLTRVEEAARG